MFLGITTFVFSSFLSFSVARASLEVELWCVMFFLRSVLLVFGCWVMQGNSVEIKIFKVAPHESQDVQKRESTLYGQVGQQSTLIPIEYLHEGYNHDASSNVGLGTVHKEEQITQAAVAANPLLATLLLSYNFHVMPKAPGFNHPQHLPINPYIALLLSHYGRYVPAVGHGGRGIYGYAASNNYHNNLPFGPYKIYEDGDSV